MTVVEAAAKRIKNVFSNGVPVYMSLSGGKDSICMADIAYNLIHNKEIDPKQLTLIFIDEEAIYDCCIDIMLKWRQKFLLAGAKEFRWYCLPFKQMSCFNHLQNTESWITWEPGKEDVWIRRPPPFAILNSHYFAGVGQENYQSFLPKVTRDGIMMTGVRAAESLQRLQYMSRLRLGIKGLTSTNTIYPIFDWRDSDVWLYIRDHHLDIPEAYMWMYQAGTRRPNLRISNFFSADTVQGLQHVAETDPDLWARIEKREPNAYMVMLYWDSEWFKKSSRTRRKLEAGKKRDYKELTRKMLFDEFDKHFTNSVSRMVGRRYRHLYIKAGGIAKMPTYKRMYEALVAGDPKFRSLRAIYADMVNVFVTETKKSQGKEVK